VPRELSLAEIFQIGYYWETKILLTAVKLDIFSTLNDEARTAGDMARSLSLDQQALTLLLNALVALRVLVKEDGRFANTKISQQYLVKSNKDYVGHLLLLHDMEWNNWGKLEETIRTGHAPVSRHIFETDPEMGANVLTVLNRIGQESGPKLAKRLDLKGDERLLDVGGGMGTNAIAFCHVYPELVATVVDLPGTLTKTKNVVAEAGLEDRISLLPGDFLAGSFEGEYDLALMSDILHYQDAETNAGLVRKVYDHLVEGGRLIIKDRFLDPSGTSPAWTTAFAVHILVNTERGRCYPGVEVMEWMKDAGFHPVIELEHCAVLQGTKGPTKRQVADG